MQINYPEVRSPLALQGMMSIIRGLVGGPKSQRFGLGDAASFLGIWKTSWKGLESEVWDGVAAAFVLTNAASGRPRLGGVVAL